LGKVSFPFFKKKTIKIIVFRIVPVQDSGFGF